MIARDLQAEVPRFRHGYVSPGGTRVQCPRDWPKHHPLEGDGLRPLLYMYLWKKNRGSESWLKNVRLPDTVVYEHNFPRAWYTYDAESKEINKHPGKMLDAQSIYQHFSKTSPGCDVVAQFLTTCTPTETSARGTAAGESGGDLITYVEYFTVMTLRDFLFTQTRKPDGILQKFVLPRSETTVRRSSQLQVAWSPLTTIVYKRVNRHRLDDHQVPLHMRTATFDGDCHLSEESLVADETKARLERLCREVVDHIYYTERKLITRLVVNFKIDDDNRAWVLWSTSVRVSSDSFNPSNVCVPMMLSMRTEILNDGSSTRDRMLSKRDRQRHLLAMDKQLFALSRDYEFGLHCNASHLREAQRLGLWSGSSAGTIHTKSATPYPLREAVRCFGDAAHSLRSARNSATGNHTTAPPNPSEHFPRRATAAAETPNASVRDELTALALDAWYDVYSSTLSDQPSAAQARRVVLSEPLTALLLPAELERLLEILGLARRSDVEGQAESPTKASEDHFVVRPGILCPKRRLDRPMIRAERDVREFFSELFANRGADIVKEFLANDRWRL